MICKNQDGVLQAFFPDRNEGVNIAELPEHEAVFAMSVHKSQGSGFSEVIFVMPEYSSQLMTREMVYTAMTRAENKLCCIGNEDVFADALSKVTERMSNLSRFLKKN